MKRSFTLGGIFAGLIVSVSGTPAFAVDTAGGPLCVSLKEESEVATLEKFFELNLKEHARYGFSRSLKAEVLRRGKDLLVQRILDRRTQLCAESLKAAEEIRAATKGIPNDSSCPSLKAAYQAASRVNLILDSYMRALASTFDENRKAIDGQREEHVRAVKAILYAIATGSTSGLEGVSYKGVAIANAPKALKYEWLKKVAADLGAEAHLVWGAVDADKNPMVQRNMDFARVAVQVRREFDAAKKRADAAAQRLQAGHCGP